MRTTKNYTFVRMMLDHHKSVMMWSETQPDYMRPSRAEQLRFAEENLDKDLIDWDHYEY